MLQRIGNRIYERCRAGTLTLPGFPEFSPVVNALRSTNVQDRSKSFRVTTQQHDTLLILEVYAKKWLATESTRERCEQAIKEHNEEFNASDKYWVEERQDSVWTRTPKHNMPTCPTVQTILCLSEFSLWKVCWYICILTLDCLDLGMCWSIYPPLPQRMLTQREAEVWTFLGAISMAFFRKKKENMYL